METVVVACVTVNGEVVNQIVVDPVTAEGARIALERMLEIT